MNNCTLWIIHEYHAITTVILTIISIKYYHYCESWAKAFHQGLYSCDNERNLAAWICWWRNFSPRSWRTWSGDISSRLWHSPSPNTAPVFWTRFGSWPVVHCHILSHCVPFFQFDIFGFWAVRLSTGSGWKQTTHYGTHCHSPSGIAR